MNSLGCSRMRVFYFPNNILPMPRLFLRSLLHQTRNASFILPLLFPETIYASLVCKPTLLEIGTCFFWGCHITHLTSSTHLLDGLALWFHISESQQFQSKVYPSYSVVCKYIFLLFIGIYPENHFFRGYSTPGITGGSHDIYPPSLRSNKTISSPPSPTVPAGTWEAPNPMPIGRRLGSPVNSPYQGPRAVLPQ